MLAPWKKGCDKLRLYIKKQRHHFGNKGLYNQRYSFSSSHVRTWELDHKEGWAPKNWCLWAVVLEKTLESPLDSKEINPANPKGNQISVFIERTNAEAPIICAPEVNCQLIGKTLNAGQDEGRKRRKNRGWDGCIGLSTQWRWIWANSRR